MEQPPIPAELKGTPKKKLDVVFAAGAGGKVYAIPLSVAEQYVSTDKHPPIPSADQLAKSSGEDEVAGHHMVLLVDGTYGYHRDWLIGPYIWICTGDPCYGPHWHPNRYSPLAHDGDG